MSSTTETVIKRGIRDRVKGMLYGAVIGDIMGVPFEFTTKDNIKHSPCTGEYTFGGFHDKPKYTWSDDTSMSYALATSIVLNPFKYNREETIKLYLDWLKHGKFTSDGDVFDIGISTRNALKEYIDHGLNHSIDEDEDSLGNGSLMRIHIMAPMIFSYKYNLMDIESEVSITHNNYKSKIICKFYAVLLHYLILGLPFDLAYKESYEIIRDCDDMELKYLFKEDISNYTVDIESSNGYIVDTLLLALKHTKLNSNFKDSIVSIINTGGDTDTNATVIGAITGALYGFSNISKDLIDPLYKLIREKEEYKELFITLDTIVTMCVNYIFNHVYPD